jgi:hypothetical protein
VVFVVELDPHLDLERLRLGLLLREASELVALRDEKPIGFVDRIQGACE